MFSTTIAKAVDELERWVEYARAGDPFGYDPPSVEAIEVLLAERRLVAPQIAELEAQLETARSVLELIE